MRNIILLIQKYRNFLFFLFLESTALFFLFSATNNYHHYHYLSSSNSLSAGLLKYQSSLFSYFSLREVNNDLMIENAYLKEQILNKNLVVGKKFIKSNDTIYRKNFLFKEVNIVNSQFKFYKNNLIINSGSQNGVVPKMGLIGTKGVIGIVTNVTNNYATVRPIINPDFGLKILHQKTNAWGDLLWVPEKNNFNSVYVNNIPIYTKVDENDFFVTSGAEGIYPKGVKIGRVISISENIEDQTLDIELKLEENFSALKIGFLVKNNFQEELNEHLKFK
ncbi:MAG: rod shape-determining protein MreC [Flavobacteriales bacterium]|jgi:rod shape-determining protein MreC|nr:rod shape-determining protein MreC [Flavobacteriales bacterium]MDG1440210.1 rod shape-determining protein MreC [Flavobacteriales bacterium]